MHYSPLRYPGGKNKLSAFIAKLCVDNNINGHYVEPYSGGASVALFLLLNNFVKKITINDKDRSIYAFWYSVLHHTERLCTLIVNTPVTIEEWKIQKGVQSKKESAGLLQLGFSTFFLNRTNRSGIINAGFMGGVAQTGDYPIDCRYNKADLIARIKAIAARKKNIRILNRDAVDLIDLISSEAKNQNVVFYFDPPYYLKASSLYMNHYADDNHQEVSERIRAIENINWIVSYDNVPQIQDLYAECNKKEYSFNHTAYSSKVGEEILFFSPFLKIPVLEEMNPVNFKYKKGKIFYRKKPEKKVP